MRAVVYVCMLVFVFLVLVRPQDYPSLADALALPLLPACLLAGVVFWALSADKHLDQPQYPLVLLFLAAMMLSWVANGWGGGVRLVLERFSPVVLAFLLMGQAVNTRGRLVGMMAMFVLCGGLLALHGIDQVQTGIGWTGTGLSQGTRIQYVGIFNDPNDLGMLFIVCLPMAMYLRGRQDASALGRLLWLGIAGMLVYGIYLTNSRGTLLALVALLGVHVWHRRGLVAAGVLGAGSLVVMMLIPSRLQEMEVSEASAMGRVDAWYHGIQMFLAHPVLGIGPGAYSDNFALTAHNSFVLVLAESGIIGFTIWLALVGYTGRMLLEALRSAAGPAAPGIDQHGEPGGYAAGAAAFDDPAVVEAERIDDLAIAKALALSFCGLLVTAFFLSRSYVVLPYLLIALVTAHYAGMRERYPDMASYRLHRDVLRWPLWSLLAVAGLFLTVKTLLAIA